MLRDSGVRIGLGVGTSFKSVREVRAEADWANEVGFDSFWVSQVFGVDPIVALASIGDSCPAINEFGTSVVPLTGRHPLALAGQARTVQSALGGRFSLGIGASHQLVSEGFFGEPYQSAFSRTEEFIAALGPLLKGQAVDVDGDHIFAKGWLDIECEPVPMLLAALGPKMLALAAEQTQGTTLGFCGPRTIREYIVPMISAAALASGRAQPRVLASVGVSITDDVEAARQLARQQNVMYDAFPSYRAMLDREGVESGADLLVAGTAEEVRDRLAAYVEAGATDLRVGIFSVSPDDHAATREFLADELRG